MIFFKSRLRSFIFISLLTTVCSWSWTCDNGFCKRSDDPDQKTGYTSLELCELVCTTYLNIWPHPTKTVTSLKNIIKVDYRNISFKNNGPWITNDFLNENIKYFIRHIPDDLDCQTNMFPVIIVLKPQTDDMVLDLNTNESYNLEIDFTESYLSVTINALTIFGIRHGLETFQQLLVPYDDNQSRCLATLSNIQVSDKPVYKHRGLLIDTARNFLTVKTIKKTIDGMAASKLNVLHWHITDSQSFPLQSRRQPNMTIYGAYSSKQIYSPEDIKDVIKYARIRGVRILLELDGPSHAGNGWQWGHESGLGNLAVCVNAQPWRYYCIQPPCGQLNPANPRLYDVLRDIFDDINDIDDEISMFHMGGDEVFINCWNSSQEIIKYLENQPLTEDTYLNLWSDHQKKVLNVFDEAVGNSATPVVIWTSHLTEPDVITKYLPKERYIIQTWVPEANNSLITDLLRLGYDVIISTKDKWYLDHGFWGNTVYHKWIDVYNNKMYDYYHQGVLGGEVCMWGELVDDNDIDSRVWPRAAAAAERLWSNPRTSADVARGRFYAHKERLERRGIQPETVIPRWCQQNQGECLAYL